MGVLMPTLLDKTLQAVWAVCIHPGPLTLNGYLDNDLQVSNSCCTLTSTETEKRKEKKRKDYAFRHQFNEKPSLYYTGLPRTHFNWCAHGTIFSV